MARAITERDFHDQSAEILAGLDRGESFIVTRDGVPVGEITPIKPRAFVPIEELKRIFSGQPRIDYQQFKRDIDAYLDQDPTPRV
jgi:antitoxin (DNA-binding transcriptional repressor) of toxin-antitoxin stability system